MKEWDCEATSLLRSRLQRLLTLQATLEKEARLPPNLCERRLKFKGEVEATYIITSVSFSRRGRGRDGLEEAERPAHRGYGGEQAGGGPVHHLTPHTWLQRA